MSPMPEMKKKNRPTEGYIKDTGLIIVLILLLIAYGTGKSLFILLAIAMLVVVMTVPVILTPFAAIWFSLSAVLGSITNRIVLTILFGAVLMPIALIRRFRGYDPMKRKIWKKGSCSVFTKRNHVFIADDLNVPY